MISAVSIVTEPLAGRLKMGINCDKLRMFFSMTMTLYLLFFQSVFKNVATRLPRREKHESLSRPRFSSAEGY